MDKLEKAIAAVKYGIRAAECAGNGKNLGRSSVVMMHTDDLDDILDLLKAQEPVKPFVTGNGHTFEEAETWWYECGNCNEPIDPNDQYCRHCGRVVKWDE